MADFLIRRLEHFTRLSGEDKQALHTAASQRVRKLSPRDDIIHEGDKPNEINLFLDG